MPQGPIFVLYYVFYHEKAPFIVKFFLGYRGRGRWSKIWVAARSTKRGVCTLHVYSYKWFKFIIINC